MPHLEGMIGIFGGTFDPIHFGHLRTALEVYQEMGLDEVRLIPCRQPPHRGSPQASAGQRLAMLEAAIQRQPGLVVDQRELHREGPSSTVMTLSSLREELADTPLCLIIGKDAFAALHTWWHWREILELAHIVVVERPGHETELGGEEARLLEQRGTDTPQALRRKPAGYIAVQPVTPLEISATSIRTMLGQGKSPRYLLPDVVLDIIDTEGLYGASL